jgi:hypothetical protein
MNPKVPSAGNKGHKRDACASGGRCWEEKDIEKLDEPTKDKLYFVIDNIIQNYKAKKAYAS